MNFLESIILGILQGITEFLPVSSSGHLTVAGLALAVDADHMLSFVTMLHMGTLLAVFVVMRKELLAILRRPFSKMTLLLIIGTLPAVAAALFLGDFIDEAFGGSFLALSFLLTAVILVVNIFFRPGRRPLSGVRKRDALTAGVAQAVAILPGVSRSGTTLTALLGTGIEREAAIRFSFLLSIPAILGGFVLDLRDLLASGEGFGDTSVAVVAAGVAAAGLSGYLVMRFMLKRLTRKGLLICAAYVGVLGLTLLTDKWFDWIPWIA